MWERIKAFFKESETIFYARLQLAVGAIAAVITYVEPAVFQPILGAQWFPWFLVANGLATEYLRRRRDTEMNK